MLLVHCCLLLVAAVHAQQGTQTPPPDADAQNRPDIPSAISEDGVHFECDAGRTMLPRNFVNDDYCDCDDGSDEPETSACARTHVAAMFWCQNQAHAGHALSLSRVGDGVCDCCDGSDEHGCVDTCAGEALVAAAEGVAQLAKQKIGLAKRRDLACDATLKRYRAKLEVADAESDVEWDKKRLLRAEAALAETKKSIEDRRVEAATSKMHGELGIGEMGAVELRALVVALAKNGKLAPVELGRLAKKAAGLPEVGEKPAEPLQESVEEPTLEEETAATDEEEETAATDEDEEKGDLEYEQDAIPPAGEDLQDEQEEEDPEEDSQQDEQELDLEDDLEGEEDDIKYEQDDYGDFDEDDSSYGGDTSYGGGEDYGGDDDEYSSNADVDEEEEEKESRYEVGGFMEDAVLSKREAKTLKKAEGDVRKLRRASQKKERALKESKSALENTDQRYGPDGALWALRDSCFEARHRGYTYKACAFGDAKQDGVSLGRYARTEGLAFIYEHGQHCFGHGDRSFKLTLECGAENVMSDVDEPATCEYTATLSTPAACLPDDGSTLRPLEPEECGLVLGPSSSSSSLYSAAKRRLRHLSADLEDFVQGKRRAAVFSSSSPYWPF